jgi:hypothetical protein
MPDELHRGELRRPYNVLFPANLLCGVLAGAFGGYKISLALIQHKHFDVSTSLAGYPYPWPFILIALMLVISVTTPLVFNAAMSVALVVLGKIPRSEAWRMGILLRTPVSLTRSHEERA